MAERVKGRFDQGSWFQSVARNPQNKTKDLLETNQGDSTVTSNENRECSDFLLSMGEIKPTKCKAQCRHGKEGQTAAERLKTSELVRSAAERSVCQVGRLSGPLRSTDEGQASLSMQSSIK